MSRPLDSVIPGGNYVEQVGVAESEFDAVVAILGTTDAASAEAARDQIRAALEDFKTTRLRAVPAKTVAEDQRALHALVDITNPDTVAAAPHETIKVVRSLEANNPVLYRRLKWAVGAKRFRTWIASLEETDTDQSALFRRDVNATLHELATRIASEDGRGRPTSWADRALATKLHHIWVHFTGRGTSRQSALGREKDPFGDFVTMVGALVDPRFDGHHVARRIHEDHKS